MDYKATLNLPKTDFPMKANLAQAEPRMLAWWDEIGIYKRLREAAADRPLWILHDGPPYANGNIHMGHVLNKVMKDLVVKSRGMLGFNAVFVPGWDCHGLPIEHQVDKELGLDTASIDVRRAMDPLEKIGKCRAYATKYVQIQREEFKRLGVFGDWDNPYITMAPAYQAVIAREFGRFVGKGLVYKGLKPVHWCMYDKTALAQAEVEYEEQRTPSVYVKFPLVTSLPDAPSAPKPSLVIWTTTPWTLPANLAIAVHPEEDYVVLEADGESLIVAAKLADAFAQVARLVSPRRLATIPGRRLEGLEYRHAWIDRTGKVATASFVDMDTGTGLVHIAPGHGEDDYELGRALGLRIYNPVDDDGRFVAEVAHFGGLTVWEANPRIIAHLKHVGALVAEQTVTHTYPHCWRCKNPTLFRATEQWFIALDKDGLRERALRAIRNDVRWIPAWGEERIFNMVAHRPDWTISRQRVWAAPTVAFHRAPCGTGRRGPQDVEVRGQRRRARRFAAQVRGRGAAPLGGGRGLHRGHPALEPDHGSSRRRLPAHAQHLPLPARQPRRLRPGARPRGVRAARRGRPVDPRSARAARRPCPAGLRGVPVPHRLPLGPQFLRGGSVRAIPRRHQGPALHLRPRRSAPARRADGVLRHLPGARAADGADPDLHRRGGVALRPRPALGVGAPRALSRGAAGVARRHAQGGVGPPARGTPRGGQGPGDGPRAEADRQRAGGARADRVGARGCAGAARRQARAAADVVHRLARRPRGRRR